MQIDYILQKLNTSKFRSSFRLKQKDFDYINQKGLQVIEQHCRDFIDNRLANIQMFKDGKQTPMRGHPVFIAQHATASCCRQCLYKWHKIEPTHILIKPEKEFIFNLIMTWIKNEMNFKNI